MTNSSLTELWMECDDLIELKDDIKQYMLCNERKYKMNEVNKRRNEEITKLEQKEQQR